MDRTSFLKNLSIFKILPYHEIENLSRIFVEDSYSKDEYIFYEGENCNWLYIVYHGRVKIIKHSPSGKDVIIDIIPHGEIFGTVALLSGDTFPASAIAGELTIILKLSKNNFYELEKRFPDIITSIAKTMGKRLISAHEVMQAMAVEKVDVRIVKALLKLFKEQSPNSEDPISITRQELADIVGTTVETSIRVLSKFEKRGLVKSKRGKIWIKKLPALEKMLHEE